MRKLAKRSVASAVVLLLAILATACGRVAVGGVAVSQMTEDQKAQAKQNFEQATGVMMDGTYNDAGYAEEGRYDRFKPSVGGI